MPASPGAALDEASILAGCRAGEPSAAMALVRLHQRPLLQSVGRLVGSWPVAEEIVQEAFLRTFDRIGEIDPRRGARWWIWRVAFNLARDHLARHSRAEVPSTIPAGADVLFQERAADPEANADAAEQRRWLAKALERLPPKLREVVVLYHLEELPFPEIAKIVGVPVAALRVRALRARSRLRAMLIEEGRV